jgi:hypothetical protein
MGASFGLFGMMVPLGTMATLHGLRQDIAPAAETSTNVPLKRTQVGLACASKL